MAQFCFNAFPFRLAYIRRGGRSPAAQRRQEAQSRPNVPHVQESVNIYTGSAQFNVEIEANSGDQMHSRGFFIS